MTPGRRLAATAILLFACAADAEAHGPATSIGRAVEALRDVTVSYEPGAAVSDVEAGGFPQIVDSNPKVAFMPAEASTELAGGPDAIAEEVAREAELDGTLVVLVGTRLSAWSDDIDDDRLAELIGEARAVGGGVSPAGKVEALVRSVQAEPTSETPWTLLVLIVVVLASGAFVAVARLRRRAPAEA